MANTNPLFPLTPKIGFGKVLTTNTATDGTGTTVAIYTAGSNGSRIDQITLEHLGTNIATVLRLFINNGASVGTATNNSLFYEATMAANTISQVAASIPVAFSPGLTLPASYVIYASVGTTIAAGIQVTITGGDF
jgi:hypothetical protein